MITLVTGDQVVIRGDSVSPVPAKGREGMVFHTYETQGHRFVVPMDAASALAAGRLDRRLFDITALQEFGYATTPDVPVITAGQARRAQKGQGWQALKSSPDKVWLDGRRKVTLVESAPQVGAPAAWQAGLTGKGVTVAVLDTGIDASHPDFAGRIADDRDFTTDNDIDDKIGHGTHVASTIAGNGAKYRGVAPDASLVIGKVCHAGGCAESAILAGMQWAAREKKAQVVNLSLGGPDSEGADLLEATIDELTAETGTLFVVAAGNDGRPETVSSPSTADAALSVGAVSKQDEEAGYSSRGPRVGDGAIKPEIAAPGSQIVAALAKNSGLPPVDGSYTGMSGTSMASPHVAGAAALLAQQRPDWRAAEIKSTLVSAVEPKLGVFAVGAGRLDVARAVKQNVYAVTNTVNFGLQRWPHDDDKPVSSKVTYRNTGSEPVTLNLTTTGQPFTVDQQITLPAKGEATTTVTADTRTEPEGRLTGRLIATAGDTRIVTPLTVHNETESYDLTLSLIGRDGKPAPIDRLVLVDLGSGSADFPADPDGTVTLRRPKGQYFVESQILGADSFTNLINPLIVLDHDLTVTLDARTAKLVRPSVPDKNVDVALQEVTAFRYHNGRPAWLSGILQYGNALPIYTGQSGAPVAAGDLMSLVNFKLTAPGPAMYHLLWSFKGSYPTGHTPAVRKGELAEVRQRYHQATPAAKFGFTWVNGSTDDVPYLAAGGPLPVTLPLERTEYFLAGGRSWQQSFGQYATAQPENQLSNVHAPTEVLRPGVKLDRDWNKAVYTPAFEWAHAPAYYRPIRDRDVLNVVATLYADSTSGRTGHVMMGTKSRIALYRDGELVGERDNAYAGRFAGMPPEQATYRAEVSMQLDESKLQLSSRTSTAWTFRSGATTGVEPLPLMNVRIAPKLDLYNTAPANRPLLLPVTVERNPGSEVAKVTDVTVESSYDDGKTWRRTPVVPAGDTWLGLETNSTTGEFVSLRVTAADKAGNRVEQTVIHAYRVKR
jgi:subtilisin family serine protease